MSFEQYGLFSDEKVLMGGDVTVIVKDPAGLGRILDSEEMMGIVSYTHSEGSMVLGGEVIFHPAEHSAPRTVIGTIDYLPRRVVNSSMIDLSLIHAYLLRSDIVKYTDVVSAGNDSAGNPGLSLSIGDSGNKLDVYVGSREIERYATGQIKLELVLPLNPEPLHDEKVVSELFLAWGVIQKALSSPKHKEGYSQPLTLIIDSMSFDDDMRDVWKVVVDYSEMIRLNAESDEVVPVLAISPDDVRFLSRTYGISGNDLVLALDYLIEKHIVTSNVGAIPMPITVIEIATYLDLLNR